MFAFLSVSVEAVVKVILIEAPRDVCFRVVVVSSIVVFTVLSVSIFFIILDWIILVVFFSPG